MKVEMPCITSGDTARPLRRTGATDCGWTVVKSPRSACLAKRYTRMAFIAPAVEPAQPPMNSSMKRMNCASGAHFS